MTLGTKEWAKHNKNIFKGCHNNCKYCYARCMALQHKQISSPEEWSTMVENKSWEDKPKLLDGRIMFPTTHDIYEEHLESHIIPFLRGWLEVGNEILITTKPQLACIKRLCEEFSSHKDKITFRFTIGSNDDMTLRFWEPNAPSYTERILSLMYAYDSGFRTSTSCEPYLDKYITEVVEEIDPHINDTIWIGKMNQTERRVDTSNWSETHMKYLSIIQFYQSDDYIKNKLYPTLKNNLKVRWKDSIRKVLGLEKIQNYG